MCTSAAVCPWTLRLETVFLGPTNFMSQAMPRRHGLHQVTLVLQLAVHAAAFRAPLMQAGPWPPKLSAVLRSSAAGVAEGGASDGHQLSRSAILRGAASIAVGVAVAMPSGAVPLNAPPPVQGVSKPEELALAQHLKATGAIFYGAYWCPFCTLQRQMFGAGAARELPYVECAEDGSESQAGLCRSQKGITGYPSWQINGRFYGGLKTLSDLQVLSGFDPSVTFEAYVPPGAPPKPKPPPGGWRPPAVDGTSTPTALALAQHLKKTGARFYGAYWCRYCNKQRQLFGAEATALLPYIECASDGYQADMGRCDAVSGYPTWEIGGKLYGGYKTVDELARLSGFSPEAAAARTGGAGNPADLGIQGLGGPVGKSDKDCTLTNGKEECEK